MKATSKSKPKRRAARVSREREIDQAEKLYKKFEKQTVAPLSKADAWEIDGHFAASSANSIYRRVGLLFLALAGKELVDVAAKDGKTTADAIAGIEYAVDAYRHLADDLERSVTRLKFSMVNRPDMVELLDAARKHHAGPDAASGEADD